MARTFSILRTSLLVIITLAILFGLLWANFTFSQKNSGEKDFLVPWLAARTFLQYGDSPYSDAATQRTQIIYYGRVAESGEDSLRLNIPFPVELFYFPFAFISNYHLASCLWMTLLEIVLAVMAFLSLQATDWRPARLLVAVLMVFSVLWIYGFLPLVNCSAVILVAVSIPGFILAIRDTRDELAGALLVIPFFKPDIAGVLVLFFFFWAVYHKRGRILAGFFLTLIFLMAVSFLVLPDWFMPFLRGMISRQSFHPGFNPGNVLTSWFPGLGQRLGIALTGILLVILFHEWRDTRNKDFRHLLWTASLTIAMTPLLGMRSTLQDYVMLFFPLIVLLSILAERWSHPGRWGVAGFVLVGFFIISWMVIACRFLSPDVRWVNTWTMTFPFLLTIGLYWMRWWAIKPPRTWRDNLP
jgi:hypothetical protein